jgi:hypothetical protein
LNENIHWRDEMSERCCKCGALIFETTILNDKKNLGHEDNLPEMKPDENDKLIVCLSCTGKSDGICKKD